MLVILELFMERFSLAMTQEPCLRAPMKITASNSCLKKYKMPIYYNKTVQRAKKNLLVDSISCPSRIIHFPHDD